MKTDEDNETYYVKKESSGLPSADFIPQENDKTDEVIIITDRKTINTGETKNWE